MANYLSNKDFFEEIIQWQNNCGILEKLPRRIIDKMQLLIDRCSLKNCFRFYANLEDMKADAMYRCLLGLYMFNYDRSNNPFAFFTSCIKNSYFQNINSEKDDARFKFSVVSEKIDETCKMDFREDSEKIKNPYTEEELIKLEDVAFSEFDQVESEEKPHKKRRVKIDNYFETGFCTYIESNVNENIKILNKTVFMKDNIDHSKVVNLNVFDNTAKETFESFINEE